MKKRVINWIKANYPMSECRYSGNDCLMYVSGTDLNKFTAKEQIQLKIGEQIPFGIIID